MNADEHGGLEVELLAHFLVDASEIAGVEQDFGRIEFFADDGKVVGDMWGAGLFVSLFASWDFSR